MTDRPGKLTRDLLELLGSERRRVHALQVHCADRDLQHRARKRYNERERSRSGARYDTVSSLILYVPIKADRPILVGSRHIVRSTIGMRESSTTPYLVSPQRCRVCELHTSMSERQRVNTYTYTYTRTLG
jgi:hypothetical protein